MVLVFGVEIGEHPVGSSFHLLDVPSRELRVWRFVEGNPVNDGVVFWILAVAYDLAVKTLSDAPAGDILHGHRIDETFLCQELRAPT